MNKEEAILSKQHTLHSFYTFPVFIKNSHKMLYEHVVPQSYLELIILIWVDNCLIINNPVEIDQFIINAKESQMTWAPAFKERDMIPSIPVILFALIAFSLF